MPAKIAVFWDFAQLHENLLYEPADGNQARMPINAPQPEVIDVLCLLNGVDQLGAIVSNRAYADWRQFSSYGELLAELPIELTQLFPLHNGNLSVYRELSADLTTYLQTPDRAEIICIIGGGSEYRQVGRQIKEAGSQLIGIGVERVTDQFWVDSCDDFRFYHRMGCRKLFSGAFVDGTVDLIAGRRVLGAALQQLAEYYGTDWIQQVRIKPAIIRLEPGFDEGLLGYDAFSQFLRDQPDLLERRHREGEQEPEYRLTSEVPEMRSASEIPEDVDLLASQYLRVAGQQGIRMPEPTIMWEGIDVYAGFLADGISFTSFSDIDQECLRLLREDFHQLSMTEVKKVRQVLFKCFLFRPSVDDTIGFHEEVSNLEDIEDRYFQLMLARIGNNINQPLEYEALSLALTGTKDQAVRLAEMDRHIQHEQE